MDLNPFYPFPSCDVMEKRPVMMTGLINRALAHFHPFTILAKKSSTSGLNSREFSITMPWAAPSMTISVALVIPVAIFSDILTDKAFAGLRRRERDLP